MRYCRRFLVWYTTDPTGRRRTSSGNPLKIGINLAIFFVGGCVLAWEALEQVEIAGRGLHDSRYAFLSLDLMTEVAVLCDTLEQGTSYAHVQTV